MTNEALFRRIRQVAAAPTVNSLATALAQAINALLALVTAFNYPNEPLPLRLRALACGLTTSSDRTE